MRNRALPALAIAVLLEAAACAEPAPPIAGIGALNALALSTGTSFGMCAGYCVTELTIEEDAVRLTETGSRSANLPPRVRTLPLGATERERIRSLIDVPELAQLQGVHGCPDCADGGTEWIQLRRGSDTIRVTFEFGRDLTPIAELQAALREQRLRFPRP
jgi:hypothetical protein